MTEIKSNLSLCLYGYIRAVDPDEMRITFSSMIASFSVLRSCDMDDDDNNSSSSATRNLIAIRVLYEKCYPNKNSLDQIRSIMRTEQILYAQCPKK